MERPLDDALYRLLSETEHCLLTPTALKSLIVNQALTEHTFGFSVFSAQTGNGIQFEFNIKPICLKYRLLCPWFCIENKMNCDLDWRKYIVMH
ncbi:hypothetical protein [Legionella bononiensis]|uniref:Uncharacterized protein n=1 Tax=Legionella bononiensis TaxID=2793102 RepID=A0ABS1WDX8_9GAMM|nr:hypothetical protein [Legionella bononiensis]MBL7479566.1 hypothetical protein [Legionella bononiensis]MBL7527559.1 hypothetical protein [Legionella bononiensis]